ncbi:MAG: DUF1257 domain-containing protein [Phycisphaerae bacterium]
MSHVATIRTLIRDLDVLASACTALGIPFTRGQQTAKLFTTEVQGDFSFKLPNWTFPVVVNAQTGEMSYDNYNGGWGNIAELHKLTQEFSLQVAEVQLEEFRLKGWNVERIKQANGDIQLVATQ